MKQWRGPWAKGNMITTKPEMQQPPAAGTPVQNICKHPHRPSTLSHIKHTVCTCSSHTGQRALQVHICMQPSPLTGQVG